MSADPARVDPQAQAAPVGDTEAAVAFLAAFHPDRIVSLTAINPEKRGIVTESFQPGEEQFEGVRRLLEKWSGKWNIYFSVAEPLRPMDKKMERTDIKAVHYLHVDIDPRAGEDLLEEQRRALALCTTNLPEGVPVPTFVVFSGGGAQAFWRLEQPIVIDGDLEKAEDAKLYNVQLERLFGADHCHNIDHIMRVPGTVNIPDAKKRKKGRVPALAKLVSAPNYTHPNRNFTKAEPRRDDPTKAFPSAASVLLGEATRISSVDDLDPWNVPDRVRVVIVQGRDPDNPKEGDNSRSAWLFDVCCNLLRAAVPDDVVYSIITDPDWAISESVVERKDSHSYALRTIARAREEVAKDAPGESDPVAWVNARYFAALEGGGVSFYREPELAMMKAEAFAFELAPYKQERAERDDDGNVKKQLAPVPFYKIWKESKQRRYYQCGFALDPVRQHAGAYNLWRGFSVDPEPGDWSQLREHIFEVLADGDETHGDYILRWTAWKLQNPALPPRTALVFKGDEGVGKGVFCNALVRIFGEHGMRVQNMKHVSGNFNAHLRNRCLLFADEVSVARPEDEGALKGLITENTIPIERKGKDIIEAPYHLGVVMASNNSYVIPAGATARRFAVFAVSGKRRGDKEYFARLFANLGLSALLHELGSMDLGDWHPETARPDTEELYRQKEHHMDLLERWWFNCLSAGELPEFTIQRGNRFVIPAKRVVEHMQREYRHGLSFKAASQFMQKVGLVYSSTGRPRGCVPPELKRARAIWDEVYWPGGWDDVDQWNYHDVLPDALGDCHLGGRLTC
ncbi:MAG: primase-helicase family protein [Woeseia sp.]